MRKMEKPTTVKVRRWDGEAGFFEGIVTGKNKDFAKVTVKHNGVFSSFEFSWEAIMRAVKTGKALRVA